MILLVDDEPAITRSLVIALEANGYAVVVAASGREAVDAVAEHQPDLVVLDLGLPDVDGIVLCRSLRTWFSNPIVVLTADGDEDRKIDALDNGADDYVTKPFATGELLARARVALRHRRALAAVVDATVLRIGDLVVDTAAHQASLGGEPVELTRTEFSLLAVLARNPGKVLTHRALLAQAWGPGRNGTTASLRVHVNQLRNKLGRGGRRPSLVTEPGVGYRLVEPPEGGVPSP